MEKCDILVSVLVWKRRCHSHGCMLDREAMPRPFRWTTMRSYFRQNSQSQLVVNLLRYETVKLVSNTETHDRHFVSLLQLSIWPGLDLIIKPFRANVTAMLMTSWAAHTKNETIQTVPFGGQMSQWHPSIQESNFWLWETYIWVRRETSVAGRWREKLLFLFYDSLSWALWLLDYLGWIQLKQDVNQHPQ